LKSMGVTAIGTLMYFRLRSKSGDTERKCEWVPRGHKEGLTKKGGKGEVEKKKE